MSDALQLGFVIGGIVVATAFLSAALTIYVMERVISSRKLQRAAEAAEAAEMDLTEAAFIIEWWWSVMPSDIKAQVQKEFPQLAAHMSARRVH